MNTLKDFVAKGPKGINPEIRRRALILLNNEVYAPIADEWDLKLMRKSLSDAAVAALMENKDVAELREVLDRVFKADGNISRWYELRSTSARLVGPNGEDPKEFLEKAPKILEHAGLTATFVKLTESGTAHFTAQDGKTGKKFKIRLHPRHGADVEPENNRTIVDYKRHLPLTYRREFENAPAFVVELLTISGAPWRDYWVDVTAPSQNGEGAGKRPVEGYLNTLTGGEKLLRLQGAFPTEDFDALDLNNPDKEIFRKALLQSTTP